jgi:NAD(P)H dehydrogenase (quinone)
MILITGANGKTGKALLCELNKQHCKVRVMVHRPQQADELVALGAAQVVSGDLGDAQAVLRACDGIETVYHIPPNMCLNELEIGRNLISAATQKKVSSFIYHSVLHPQIAQMQHHWNKLLVEQEIFTSGLNYSIVQPTAYMQNILGYWAKITSEGLYAPPYSAQTRLGMVDLNDVATAAAKICLGQEYRGGVFELVGSPAYSQSEVAELISQKICRNVLVAAQPRSEWETAMRNNRMDDYSVQTLLKMFEYYENFGMWGSPFVLRSILGRSPTSFSQFIDRVILEKRNETQR